MACLGGAGSKKAKQELAQHLQVGPPLGQVRGHACARHQVSVPWGAYRSELIDGPRDPAREQTMSTTFVVQCVGVK
eukprot:6052192-Pyramimonas_sp.AAC.1